MKMFFLLAISVLPLTSVHAQQRAAANELREKNEALGLLLMHAYGPHNPFECFTETIRLCLDTDQATPAGVANSPFIIQLRQEILPALEATVTALLSTFVHNQDKTALLRELNARCLVIETALKAEKNQKMYRKLRRVSAPTRFFMVDPGILGVIGKGIAGCALAAIGYMTIKKIITHLTAANTEALQGATRAQEELATAVFEVYKKHMMQGHPSAIVPATSPRPWQRAWKKIKSVFGSRTARHQAATSQDASILSTRYDKRTATRITNAMQTLQSAYQEAQA